MRFAIISISVLTFITLAAVGCGKVTNPIELSQPDGFRNSGYMPDEYCGDPTVVPLIAGKHINVGEVTVTNDEEYLYIEYTTWE